MVFIDKTILECNILSEIELLYSMFLNRRRRFTWHFACFQKKIPKNVTASDVYNTPGRSSFSGAP